MDKSDNSLILVVDDDFDNLSLLELLLSKNGYNVIISDNGNNALKLAQERKPDLIILDIIMPVMDGYEVCARLQQSEELALIPVIFLTSLHTEQDKAKALAAGAVDFITKPVSYAVLLNTVNKYIITKSKWSENFPQTDKQNKLILRPQSDVDTIDNETKDVVLLENVAKNFAKFKEFLFYLLKLPKNIIAKFSNITSSELYSITSELNITPGQLAQYIAQFLSLHYTHAIDAESVELGLFPAPFCKKNYVIPVKTDSKNYAFIMSNPFSMELLDSLYKFKPYTIIITEPENITGIFEYKSGKKVHQEKNIEDIEQELRKVYQTEDDDDSELPAERSDDDLVNIPEELTETRHPIILFVNKIIEMGYTMGASDIHIEPWEYEVVVRYRIDGNMRNATSIQPRNLILPIVSRLKIMANLDIAERRKPQDGRIIYKKFNRKSLDFDLRISIVPSNFGEKVVMRILDKQKAALSLEQLGLSEKNLTIYHDRIKAPYGMILHVGPTGSGKSMTLYSALKELQTPEINIHTIEDPIEYTLAGITQLQINPDIGLTFGDALRAFLRQDPDILLVGEIRDRETAQISVQAALTGHLLLSTMHTNDAPSAIVRFIDMDIEPFMISSSIILICAQRLLPRLCNKCREPYKPDALEKQMMAISGGPEITLYKPKGCEACNATGYKGRIGIHEILVPNDHMRIAMNKKSVTVEELKRIAVTKCGMTTLYWDAVEKVKKGIISFKDVVAKILQDEFDSNPNV